MKIKMCVGLHRVPDLTRLEFLDHWRTVHAPLVKSLSRTLGIEKYVQLHPLPADGSSSAIRDDAYDGVAEIWFASVDAMRGNPLNESYKRAVQRIRNDEIKFIDPAKSVSWIGVENAIL